MNRAFTLAVVTLLASGCIPDTKKLDPYRSAGAVCPVLFDLLTAKLAECRGFAPYLADRYYTGSLPSCDMVAAGEKAGRLGYDRAVAESCIKAIDAPGCDMLESACADSPFVPKVPPGSFCVNHLECTAASAGCYHQYPTCGNSRCLPEGGLGAPCGTNVDPSCDKDHYCNTAATTWTCAALATAGASCATVPCASGLYCAAAICVAQLSQGAACTSSSECSDAQHLFCDTSTSPNTCQPKPTSPSGLGGRCDYPYDCSSTLWCDSSAAPPTPPTCKAKVPVPAPCTRDSACATPGSACILDAVGGTTSHCALLLGEGSSCTQGLNACQVGLACLQAPSGGARTCTRYPTTAGAACGIVSGEQVACGEGFYCDRPAGATSGTCKAAVAAGQPCPNFVECGSGGFGWSRTECLTTVANPQVRTCVAACRAP